MTLLRRLPPLETALVVLAIVVLGIVGGTQRDAQDSGFDSFSSYDAGSGGYRAWYELLQREGVRVERFERLPAFLDAHVDTLIWADPLTGDPRALETTQADIVALQDWVKAGGRLIYLGTDDAAAAKGVLKLPFTTGKPRGVRAPVYAPSLRAAGVARVAWSQSVDRFALKRGAPALVRDRYGALALRYAYGRGALTVVADRNVFSNRVLSDLDNARFAFALAAPGRAGGSVAFDEAVHGYFVPEHWWQIVPRPFLIGVLCAAFALLLAFAGAAVRLGPPIVPPALREPTSLEFLDSVAGLLERGHGARQAVTDAVRSTKRAVANALGLPEDAPNDAIAARIDSSSLRADFTALVAFERPLDPDDPTLLRAAVLAQRLRKEYAPYAGSRR